MPKKKWNLLTEPYLELKAQGYGCSVIAKKLNISKSLAKRLRHLTNSEISAKYLYCEYTRQDIINVIACVLGDGCLSRDLKSGSNYYGVISHISDNLDYLQLKKTVLDNLVTDIRIGRRAQSRFVNGRWITCKQDYALQIKTSPHLEPIYNMLYIDGKKTITPQSLEYFTDMTLAFLYFDDGSFAKSRKTYRISMGNMDVKYIEVFREWLNKTYNIETSLYSTYGYYSIYIKRKSHTIFENIIKKYVVNSMQYKINDEVKSDKLLETPEEDNQQPS